MRKIIAASVVGLALVAGQAVASNGAAQSLRVGDRVGAALGEREDFALGSWLANGGFFSGMGMGGALFTSTLLLGTTFVVVDQVSNDNESSPS